MGKQLEKYYNYIVKDMVRRTNITDRGYVILPFFPGDKYMVSIFDSMEYFYEGIRKTYIMDFWNYVEKHYGIMEDEMEPIYQKYLTAMEDKLIDMGYIIIDDGDY